MGGYAIEFLVRVPVLSEQRIVIWPASEVESRRVTRTEPEERALEARDRVTVNMVGRAKGTAAVRRVMQAGMMWVTSLPRMAWMMMA